jgi:hypothetical protein
MGAAGMDERMRGMVGRQARGAVSVAQLLGVGGVVG